MKISFLFQTGFTNIPHKQSVNKWKQQNKGVQKQVSLYEVVFFLPLDFWASPGDVWVAISTSLDLGSPRFPATGAFRGFGTALGLFFTPLTSAGDKRAELNSSKHLDTSDEVVLQFERLIKMSALGVYSRGEEAHLFSLELFFSWQDFHHHRGQIPPLLLLLSFSWPPSAKQSSKTSPVRKRD